MAIKPRIGDYCRPNPLDKRDFKFSTNECPELLRSSGEPIPVLECLPLVAPVQDQGSTASCVAHGILGSNHDWQLRQGRKLIPKSRRYSYYYARRRHQKKVVDAGTYIRAGAQGISSHGFCDEVYFPYSTDSRAIDATPDWNAHMQSIGHEKTPYYHIFDIGTQRLEAIEAALLLGYSVVFGQVVWKEFGNDHGPFIIDFDENVPTTTDMVGGHCMRLTGWETSPFWGKIYRVTNSWGVDWRCYGHIWYTRAMVMHGIRDLTVFEWR